MAFFGSKRGSFLLVLALVAPTLAVRPCRAQKRVEQREANKSTNLFVTIPDLHLSNSRLGFDNSITPLSVHGIWFSRPAAASPLARNHSWEYSVTLIDRMEAAFYCNDTPFIDQVRLPLATVWGGRIRLVGFESDVTTANFVLGLPGGGTLHSMSMFGSGHLATWTPPSDQLAGINMVFTFRPREAEPGENSGLRGLQYVVRASRGFLQSVSGR
jgi:hypothetical protein